MDFAARFEELKQTLALTGPSGFVPTHMDNVRFFWSTEPVPRAPLPHSRGIIILGRGHKVGYLNGREFRYDSSHYLIASVPTAYECETHASPDNPVLGILVDLDMTRLGSLVDKVMKHAPDRPFKGSNVYFGVEPVRLDGEMQHTTSKLLGCLSSPLEAEVLGQGLVDEITYRALLGEHGQALVALSRQDSRYARIAQSLSYIHENYHGPIAIEDLAEQAHMSLSTFHRAFKGVTGESPLQYLKKVRLEKARFLIMRDGKRVGEAANRVGYESQSQFSREFKRYFRVPPSAAQEGAYADLFR